MLQTSLFLSSHSNVYFPIKSNTFEKNWFFFQFHWKLINIFVEKWMQKLKMWLNLHWNSIFQYCIRTKRKLGLLKKLCQKIDFANSQSLKTYSNAKLDHLKGWQILLTMTKIQSYPRFNSNIIKIGERIRKTLRVSNCLHVPTMSIILFQTYFCILMQLELLYVCEVGLSFLLLSSKSCLWHSIINLNKSDSKNV